MLRSNAHRPDQIERAPKRVNVPFCGHAQSPAPRDAGKDLVCGGEVALCPIAGGPKAS
ncbi:MAG: hypothetical protein U1D06_07925 [Paracoccaceae bacterium]|nr:hypothetical protein [Paracoccaceae bacterium]